MIIRNQHKRQFTMVDTKLVRSRLLRPDELGLYTLMLSHTDDWNFNEKTLSREADAARGEIRAILNRLREKGFVMQRRDRFGVVWDLIEDPSQQRNAADASVSMRQLHGETGSANAQQPQTCDSGKDKTPAPGPTASAESPQMTHEQMATNFFALAEKLKKEAAARKMKS